MDKDIIHIVDKEKKSRTNARETFKNTVKKIIHSKSSYLFFCFIIPLILMRIIYFAVDIAPEKDGSVLVLDLNGQYVYFYEALRNFWRGDASLLYSFSRALGGEFLGIFAYYVASPLAWIVVLFPQGKMLEALLCIFLLKTGLCGFTFGFYLHKTSRHINKFHIVTFSTMYALCSYAIVQQHNSMWIDALIWLPIITYAIEELIKKGHYKLFVISLSIMLISHYYIGYMVCIYVALYFFYYFFATQNNNIIEEKLHFMKSFLRIGIFSLIAIGIAAFVVFGAYYSLQFGKNTFSTPNWDPVFRYDLIDLTAKALPGAYDTVRPAGLPIIYCGTLTLLLLPAYYLAKKISLREKVLSTLLMSVFLISFTLSPLDIMWHGFQVPNWLNYRYSFIFSFLLLVMAYKALGELRKIPSKIVLFAGGFIIFLTTILEKFKFDNFLLGPQKDAKWQYEVGKIDTLRTVWFTILAVVAICTLIYAFKKAKKPVQRRIYSKLLLCTVCFEMLLNGIVNITALDMDVTFSSYSSYNGYFEKIQPVVAQIQEKDDSFYRMEKTHHRKTNDNMTLKINGLSGSTSTLNKETIMFLSNMGYASKSHWSKYLGGTPVNDSLLGVKYIVSQNNQPSNYSTYNENQAVNALMKELYTVAAQDENYTVYKNPYALSIAYSVSEDVKSFDFVKANQDGKIVAVELSPFERLNQMISTMLGKETKVFLPIDINYSNYTNAKKSTIAGHTKYAVSTSGTESSVTMNITSPIDGLLFFYAPSEYPRETSFYINNVKYGDFMAKESNRIKSMGLFKAGDEISVKLKLSGDNLYLKNDVFYFYCLDVEAFEEAINVLSSNQYIIESYTDSSFNGSITTQKNKTVVQTTIPYDEGWKVFVDGKQVPIYKTFNALVAFDVNSEGPHSVKMEYMPDTVVTGAITSVVSILIFAGIWITESLINKKKEKKISVN